MRHLIIFCIFFASIGTLAHGGERAGGNSPGDDAIVPIVGSRSGLSDAPGGQLLYDSAGQGLYGLNSSTNLWLRTRVRKRRKRFATRMFLKVRDCGARR